jgi:type IV secretory pathway VirB4 component
MANAALANAVFAQQAQRTVKLAFTQEKDIPVNENGETERRKQFSDDNKDEERNNCSRQQLDKNNAVESIVKDPKSRIEAIWGSSNSDHTNAWKTTAELIRSEIEALLKLGTEAYQAAEFQARESKLLQDELDGKDDELERLRLAESKGRATIVVRTCFSQS